MTIKRIIILFAMIMILVVPIRSFAATTRLAEDDQQSPSSGQESEGQDDQSPVIVNTAAPDVTTPTNTAAAPAADTSAPTNGSSTATTVAAQDSTVVPLAAAIPQTSFPWAWVVTRSAGIASFILLALMTIIGVLLTTGVLYRVWSPAIAWSVHRGIATALLVSIVAHIVGLLTDHFINLRIVDVFVPFVSPYRPLLVALGIGGFYLLLLLLATSLYTITRRPTFWRTIHFLGFPMFILIFLHGVLIGTDANQWWMTGIYWVSAILVGLSIAYRLYWKYRRPAVRSR